MSTFIIIGLLGGAFITLAFNIELKNYYNSTEYKPYKFSYLAIILGYIFQIIYSFYYNLYPIYLPNILLIVSYIIRYYRSSKTKIDTISESV
mgnify:FL=1|jgi:hypothetical protein